MEESAQNTHCMQLNHLGFSEATLMQSIQTIAMANAAYYNPQQIEYMVELEMSRIKANWLRLEEQYVERSVLENPITIERRPTNKQQQQQPEVLIDGDEVIDVVSGSTDTEDDRKQQKADACRRSRHNNKIKKAKLKYRHKYMSQKLQSSMELFDNILDVVARAERQLLSRGFSRASIQLLRKGFKLQHPAGC